MTWSNKTYGLRCSEVITFQGLDHVTDFFLNRMSPHELSLIEVSECPIDKLRLTLGDLQALGLIGEATSGLLYNETPMGYC